MTVDMPDDLVRELRATRTGELELVDPESNRVYVVVDRELHREAKRALQEQQDMAAIAQGIADMEAGAVVPLDEAFEGIRARLESRNRS